MAIKVNGQTVIDDDKQAALTSIVIPDTGSFAVVTPPEPTFQGSNFGYTSGGSYPLISNTIDKFPFAADANATDVGDLTQARSEQAEQSSTESGYNSGGKLPVADTIDKFPFAADANATDVGDLTQARRQVTGQQY